MWTAGRLTISLEHEDSVMYVLEDTTLLEVEGMWTLFYKGQRYVTLLDARCRQDALHQVEEMAFMKIGSAPVCSQNRLATRASLE